MDEELELLERYSLYHKEEFQDWMRDTTIEEPFRFYRTRECHKVVNFKKHVFPKLQAAIREELDSEGVKWTLE